MTCRTRSCWTGSDRGPRDPPRRRRARCGRCREEGSPARTWRRCCVWTRDPPSVRAACASMTTVRVTWSSRCPRVSTHSTRTVWTGGCCVETRVRCAGSGWHCPRRKGRPAPRPPRLETTTHMMCGEDVWRSPRRSGSRRARLYQRINVCISRLI